MTTYTIDQENNVTAHAAAKDTNSQPGAERFSTNADQPETNAARTV